jgi:hypothetical protein
MVLAAGAAAPVASFGVDGTVQESLAFALIFLQIFGSVRIADFGRATHSH